MAGINYTFDASQYAPEQSAGSHPIGKFLAAVSNTEIKPTKDNSGGMFVVEFQTEAGRISMRYNLWNNSVKAVEIAHKQLSALSHATGVFRINMGDEGAALRGARLMIEVGKQAEGEYTEVKRVLDANGNEPGRGPVVQTLPQAAAQAPAQPQAFAPPPMQPQPEQPAPAPAWGGAGQGQPAAAMPQASWGGAPTQAAPQPMQQQPAAWTQGQTNGAAAGAPAWAR